MTRGTLQQERQSVRSRIRDARETGTRWLKWLFRPNPRRFLVVWYSVWLLLSVHAFVVNWLIHHQPIRLAWIPVSGPVETLYLLAEIIVVSLIVVQAWRLDRGKQVPS